MLVISSASEGQAYGSGTGCYYDYASCTYVCESKTSTYGQFEQRQTTDFLNALSQIVTFRGQSSGNRLAQGIQVEQGLAAGGGDSRWNVWGGASYASFGYSFQPLKSSGHGSSLLGGVDYTFANEVVFGTAVTLDNSRIATDFNRGRLNGNGNSVAPYIAIPLNRNWALDASVGLGKVDLDSTNSSGVTSSLDDQRSFRALSLSYFSEYQRWQFAGKGSYLAAEDHFSQTSTTASSHLRMEQLRLGGQAGYDLGTVQPFFAAYYISDIGTTHQVSASGQKPANDRDAWQLQLGLSLGGRGPVSGGVTLFSEVSRSQVRNDAILANVAYHF
jgi:hypothetical protein